jgi:hypothetical protein
LFRLPKKHASLSFTMARQGQERGTELLDAMRESDASGETEVQFQGPKALSLAVLKDAIQCLRGLETEDAEERQLAWRARRWIESDDWDLTFSFNNVCATLKLDPAPVRRRLLGGVQQSQAPPKLAYAVPRRTMVRIRNRRRG